MWRDEWNGGDEQRHRGGAELWVKLTWPCCIQGFSPGYKAKGTLPFISALSGTAPQLQREWIHHFLPRCHFLPEGCEAGEKETVAAAEPTSSPSGVTSAWQPEQSQANWQGEAARRV